MAALTVLSVDGRDGIDITSSPKGCSGALESIPHVAGAAGRSGMNAPPPHPGEFAGMLQVELSYSKQMEGGINIKAIKQRGSRQIAPETEVLPRSKVLFSAIGGKGEPGGVGGDGEAGAVGEAGSDATRDVEAGDGGAGGAGGPAGLGSNGAAGGKGGFVQLVVGEEQLEILYGVDCDVNGGQGGAPGRHGTPGRGGTGGKGGNSHAWENVVDHKYKCTPSCVGASTDMAILGSQRDASMDVFMRRLQEQASSQSTFNKTIARAISVQRRPQAGSVEGLGVCKCHGGPSTCLGCLKTPIYQSFARSAGRNGPDGASAQEQQGPLVKGAEGLAGQLSILVSRKNGEIVQGVSRFNFQLISFDIDDGNADGIYEPGDVIFIRRIQVKNTGGVVSPITPISCKIAWSNMIEMSHGIDASAHLPSSIPAGSIQVSAGGIQARLLSPTLPANLNLPYSKEESIGLVATMPWTMLPVEGFEFKKKIKIEFPIEIKDIKTPSSITIGGQSAIGLKIFNKSTRLFGIGTDFWRVAKVVLEVDREQAELLADDGSWNTTSTKTVPQLEPRDTVDVTQTIRVNSRATVHAEIEIKVQLYITGPQQTNFTQPPDTANMKLIETHRVRVQAAPSYIVSKEDEVLVVTNQFNKGTDIDPILSFFQSELGLTTKVWNVSQYGGLIKHSSACMEEVESILADFKGKTVIMMGNEFPLCGESMTVVSLCDPLSMLAASRHRTSCLFFGTANSDKYRESFDSLFRPIEGEIRTFTNTLPNTSKHKTFKSLIQCLLESTSQQGQSHLIEIRAQKFRPQEKIIASAAKELAEMLLTDIPLYHFNICIMPKQEFDANNIAGYLLVQQGSLRTSQIQATQSDLLKASDSMTTADTEPLGGLRRRSTRFRRNETHLTAYDKLSLVSALPVARRMNILDEKITSVTPEVLELIELSIERQIDVEMQHFIGCAKDIKLKGALQSKFLRDCLPTTSSMMDHVAMRDSLSPQTRRIVAYSFASCRPQSTGVAISQAVNPMAQARRLIEKLLTESMGKRKDVELDDSSSPDKRRVALSLETRITKVTGQAAHFQRLASYGPSQSLRTNDILSIDDWNKTEQRTMNMRDEVLRIFDKFQDEQEQFEAPVEPRSTDHFMIKKADISKTEKRPKKARS